MSLHSSLSPEAILNRIERDQTSGDPLPADAQQRVADFVALAIERMKAEKLAASMPCADQMFDGFSDVANMTPEEEARLNQIALMGGEA